jgi:hypothetical protein
MKTTRFLILASLAVATLGLSSCVVDDDYHGTYAYVDRPHYRDHGTSYYYGARPRYYRTYSDGYYHRGPVRTMRGEIHGARANLHRAVFH